MNGVCEEKISRGRRFFMLGALALPVAAQIARVAEILKPPEMTSQIEFNGENWIWNGTYKVGDLVVRSGARSLPDNTIFTVTSTGPYGTGSMVRRAR